MGGERSAYARDRGIGQRAGDRSRGTAGRWLEAGTEAGNRRKIGVAGGSSRGHGKESKGHKSGGKEQKL